MTVSQPHESEIFRAPDRAHPFDILSADDAATACQIGFERATGYREVLQAAIDQLAAMTAEAHRLRDRLDRAYDEIRRLRQVSRSAA